VSHPFHPLYGRRFDLVEYRQSWGENRVYYVDEQGVRRSMPAEWTDVICQVLFVEVSAGRSRLSAAELLELTEIVRDYRKKR
jgi:Family of unknown function (DUF5372)